MQSSAWSQNVAASGLTAMCLLFRFSKYISVPILSWLEVDSFTNLETALGKARLKLSELTQEYPDLFERCLFSPVEPLKLSRKLIRWRERFGISGWNDLEVVMAPSLTREISSSLQTSIFSWFFPTQSQTFESIIQSMQTIKKVRVHAKMNPEAASVFLKHTLLVQSLHLECSSINWRTVARCQLLSSITTTIEIIVIEAKALCQLPHLAEVHLLGKNTIQVATLFFACPTLTALTMGKIKDNKEFADAPDTKCQLTSLCCDMFQGYSFSQFVLKGCGAALTHLNLENQTLAGAALVWLSDHCPLLTDLTLPTARYPTSMVLTELTKGLSRLTSLNALHFGFPNSDCIQHIAQSCPVIIKLALTVPVSNLCLFTSLQSLRIVQYVRKNGVLDRCCLSHLRHFEYTHLNPSVLPLLTAQCSLLEEIRLKKPPLDELDVNDALQLLCSSQPNLREFSYDGPISSSTMIAILKSCPRLVEFAIVADNSLTAKVMGSTVALITQLKVLSITSEIGVWGLALLSSIARSCRRMESFSLTLCGHYTLPLVRFVEEMHEINPDLKVDFNTEYRIVRRQA